jgi:hypothetical protein
VVAVERHRVHLADADPGDADLVVGLEPTGLGEVGVVRRPATDDRQLVGVEREQDEGGHHGEADGADHDRVALSEGGAHCREHLLEWVL